MANPLDIVTQDDSEDTQLSPFDAAKMRGISIRPTNGADVTSAGNDPLTKLVAPEPQAQQSWTMDDLMKGLAALKEHVMTGEFSPGTKVGNRMFGTGGEERQQLWPERMIRNGFTLPGNVASGAEPIIDPATGRTSERVIERAMDTAGLAGGSALIERPGAASMGSGPVRQFRRGANENLNPEAMPNAPEFYVKPSRDELFVAPVKKEYKAYPEIDDPNKWRVIEISHDAYSQTSKDVKNGLLPEAAKVAASIMTADAPAKYVVAGGKGDPHIGQQFGSEAEARAFARKNRKTVHDLYMRDPRMVEAGGRGHQGGDLHLTGFDTPEQAHEALAHLNSGGNYDLTNGFKMLPGKTLLSDTQQPGAAVAAAASSKGPAPVFYSALEHAATNAAQETMSPQQWLGYLKNQPGVKQEELNWTGIGDWLSSQKGKVKKEDVQAYLDEHKVEIKDVTKSGKQAREGDITDDLHDQGVQAVLDAFLEDNPKWVGKEHTAAFERAHEAFAEGPVGEQIYNNILAKEWEPQGAVRYSDYQLPGGENYREHLLTMPSKGGETKPMPGSGNRSVVPADYHSSHWDEPNVLAHVRTNDRDVGGKKSLHIEEIQSDWHQQGRKQGYKKNEDTSKWTVERQPDGIQLVKDDTGKVIDAFRIPGHTDAQLNSRAAAGEDNRRGVPDAPFKTSWPELALKRMIRHAAENGYDRISWTPGEAQAARYDLSKSIDAIRANLNPDGTFQIGVQPKGRNMVPHDTSVSAEKLASVVGKELADKITKEVTEPGVDKGKKFEGLDLKVGGEGMREFYDKMLPKMAEKIGKAHGVKVKRASIKGDFGSSPMIEQYPEIVADLKRFPDWKDTDPLVMESKYGIDRAEAEALLDEMKSKRKRVDQPVHYFDLPQSLRDHAIGKGFPLYMSGVPFPLTPVDYDPFKKDK